MQPEFEKQGLLVERRVDGRLWAGVEGEAVPVRLVRCFPWSAPARMLSLRDEDDEEVALVSELGDLDDESRDALAEALLEAGFVLEIVEVLEVEEDVEIRRWKVRTRQGPRSFQTALDAWPREAPNGGLLMEDVAGDLFRIPPQEELDPRSRKLVWAFLD
jgi:glycine/D-amino acid oxidase-like deaminating enzyme